jgi:hypothetical protein
LRIIYQQTTLREQEGEEQEEGEEGEEGEEEDSAINAEEKGTG